MSVPSSSAPSLAGFICRIVTAASAARALRMEIRMRPAGSAAAVFELEALIMGATPEAANRPDIEFIWLLGDAVAPEIEIRAFDAEGRLLLGASWPTACADARDRLRGGLAHV